MGYDPLRDIIIHTLPLTLTDRLWTGAGDTEHRIRDATIGLYRVAAGWYDPYSTQGIHAGVSVPQAPAGVSVNGGMYRRTSRISSDSGLQDLVVTGIASTGKALLGEFVLNPAVMKASEKLYLSGIRQVRLQYWEAVIEHIQVPRQSRILQYLLGSKEEIRLRWVLRTEMVKQQGGISELLEKLVRSKGYEKVVDLGMGISIDVAWQGMSDLPKLVSSDLDWTQFGGRIKVAAVGSGASWIVALVVTAVAGPGAGFVAGVLTDMAYDTWVVPWWYERRDYYPKSQQVGPMEPLPY